MPCPFQWLVITDGTLSDAGIRNQVDLLSPEGFCVLADGDWRPAITEPKGGGVWRDSQLAEGRRPADFKAQNVTESMTLTVSALDQDALIRDTQNLRRLLNKARTYGTTAWQDEPVWIEAKSPGESEIRYAIIWDYRTPNDGNPYEQPFFQLVARAGMDDFILTLEREPYWRADEPKAGNEVAIGVTQTYNGITLGNVDDTGTADPTTDEEVYVANKQNVANITNIHYWDSNANAWSANLMGVGLPFAMLPNPVLAADVVIFGINTAIADSGPFSSLVFDIGTAMTNVTGTQWKFSFGGPDPTVNWNNLTVQDNTNQDGAGGGLPFDTLGVNSVHWAQHSAWVVQNPQVGAGPALGVTGYWVALDIITVGGGDTPPSQRNRDIYSITWPYIEADPVDVNGVLQIGGDVPALAKIRSIYQGLSDGDDHSDVVVGLRSTSRGTDFAAYINLSSEQNHAGITIAVVAGGAINARLEAPTGLTFFYGPAGISAMQERARITFTGALSQEYYGTYHVYLRGKRTGGSSTDFQIRLLYKFGPTQYSPTITSIPTTNDFRIFDMGKVTLGGDIMDAAVDVFTSPYILVEIYSVNGAPGDLWLYDLILIPTDEFATHCIFPGGTDERIQYGRMLDIDSVYTKRTKRALLREYSDNDVTEFWIPIQTSPTILQHNATQRLWFLFFGPSFTLPLGVMEASYTILLEDIQRYLSMRGSR